MTNYTLMFSVLFFAVFIIALILGLYVLQNNSKAPANRCFFAMILSVCFWSLGFSLAGPAAKVETSEIWRRFAAIGWGTLYANVLHFSLIITGKKNVLKKWWIYLLLYLPAVLNILAFVIPAGLAKDPYLLELTEFGWVNIAGTSAWDWLFYIYYVVYSLAAIILILIWGTKSADKSIRVQSRIIFLSFILALVIGSITDVLLNLITANLPQMAPIVIMIPITAVYYAMKKYGFLVTEQVDKNELILDDSSTEQILRYISIVFFVGAAISIFFQLYFFDSFSSLSVILYGVFLIAAGVLAVYLSKSSITAYSKEIIIAIVFAALIPIITLQFLQFAGITVWALAFVMMIISLVFNKRLILTAVVTSSIFTQILLWVILPQNVVQVTKTDYITRIVLLFTSLFVAIYVNRLYVQRLKENVHQTAFQRLVSEISYHFVRVDQDNLEDRLKLMLQRAGLLTQCDKACLVLFQEEKTIKHNYEWHKDNDNKLLMDIPPDMLTLWIQLLRDDKPIVLEDKWKVSSDDIRQKIVCKEVRAFVAMPVKKQDELLGFLGFCSRKPMNHWNMRLPDELGIIANITADALIKVSADDEIRFMAYYDQITKLPNRFLLTERMNQATSLSVRSEQILCVVFISLDSLKLVNNSMGHEQGDLLLVAIADSLRKHVRSSDTVARVGSEEFAILLHNVNHVQNVVRIVKSILDIFQSPFVVKGQEFFVTANAGAALFPQDGNNAQELLKNADIAAYKAKKTGKNQFALCSEEMKAEAVEQLKLTNLLYRALEREQLLVYYQPQIDIQTGHLIGLEALLRWNLPGTGLISPGKFIPLAERSGLINPIGEWVLRTACHQNKKWQDMGFPVQMGVNLSLIQLRNPNLISILAGVLKETGLQPQSLELEITESIANDPSNNLMGILEKIKMLGVKISIDDFGTEYSSLSRLKSLPIDRIKIDIQFIRDLEIGEKDKAIVAIIINLAKSLGLKVIAEGVETEKQLEFLKQKGCDEAQGYYYYKPMPVDDVDKLLKTVLQ